MKSLFKSATALTIALAVSATTAIAGPNLVPGFSVKTGTVKVANNGDANASRSIATVHCNALSGGSCPDPAPAAAAPYELGGFPDVAGIKFGPINAGSSSAHTIAFFGGLVFAPGKYVFTVCVDAGSFIAEDNEADNCRRFLKTVGR